MERYQTQAEKAGVTTAAHLPAPLMANANRDQIEQVLINLLDNAIKYTPAGGRVDIRAEESGDLLTVEVADTGIGIMSQDLPRVFERFYRVDKARSRQSGGTGLGPRYRETHRGNARRQRDRAKRVRARHHLYLHAFAQRSGNLEPSAGIFALSHAKTQRRSKKKNAKNQNKSVTQRHKDTKGKAASVEDARFP